MTIKIKEDPIFDQFHDELLRRIGKLIMQNEGQPNLAYESNLFQFKELDNFSYSKSGPNYTGATIRQENKKTWVRASLILGIQLFGSEEFIKLENHLIQNYDHPYTKDWFKQYLYQLIAIVMEGPNSTNPDPITTHKKKFIGNLIDAPLPATISAKFKGLILESKELIINQHIKLRQTIKSDLEKPINIHFNEISWEIPSAILEIGLQLKSAEHGLLNREVKRIVTLLSLFKTGSIHIISTESSYHKLTSTGGQSSSNRSHHPWKKYHLVKTEEDLFLSFLNNLNLPEKLYTNTNNPDYLTTAFDRFNEALLEEVAIERRIANAVMGIEALLSIENQELSFRMQSRTARLLSIFNNLKAIDIRTSMAEAYSIRSKYAHGGYLEEKDKKRLKAKFQDLDQFVIKITDYLRLLLLITITCHLEKPKLIRLIDDALIDDASLSALRESVQVAKQVIIKPNDK